MSGLATVLLALCGALTTTGLWAQTFDQELLEALEWRNVGPHRGGRVTTVTGVPSQPFTFYMGATGGGVWKTTDGGENWNNISDGFFKTGSVGAIAVSLSDPNVIYVGMGEHCVRGVTTSHGDGVYKSTDGGRTWRHLGLEATRHISQVRIHPDNPDIVYVGAQGSPWGAHEERGVYRSTDGGATWERVLHVNENTGVNDLVMDPNNPRILYAAQWEHVRKPWHGYQLSSGGPGSGLYRSTDSGDTWQRLENGFPEPAGKFAVTVSAADSDRVYALVEAKPGDSGVYRSDDGGSNWSQVNDLHVMTERSAYYMHIFADPADRETVYVLNAPMFKSTDGGKTYKRVATPHGDNHDLWIHPEHPDWMVQANDGGANVSFDGGQSWSTQTNQPTAQFYRVITDNQFPYNLYAGQQDNSTVRIQSRDFDGGIGWKDWNAIGGGESAHVAFDPDNPVLVYAGSYQGRITEYDAPTGMTRNVMRYPQRTAFRPGEDYPYRFNWNAPILASQHDPSVIYHGAQVLLKSTDRGHSWSEISPDLTRNEPDKQGIVLGDFTFEGTGGEMYNTIFYIAESPHAAGEIWAGTDDGRIHLTRDEGANWTEITPRGLGERQINMIEISPHRAGKAYAVATGYKSNDFTPYVYRTDDFGRSWDRVDSGIPEDDFVRVVREDTEREGLLFAGSETSLYVSFDDGAHWQSLQRNLPHVPVTDLRVHEDDLVAATQGRAFWILDDIGPLRQLDGTSATAAAHLFAPSPTERVTVQSWRGGEPGANPPTGTLIYYALAEGAADNADTVRLEILDAEGRVLNTFGTESPVEREERLVAWFRNDQPRTPLQTRAGLNRFVWDWRVADLPDYPELSTWRGPRSYRVAPGTYQARLTVGDRVMTQSFEVLDDPRAPAPASAHRAKQSLLAAVHRDADAAQRAVETLKRIRDKNRQLMELAGDEDLNRAGEAVNARISAWLEAVIEEDNPHYIDPLHSSRRLDFNLVGLLGMADNMIPPLTAGMQERIEAVRAQWSTQHAEYRRILDEDLAAFNREAADHAMPAIEP
ncbi:WD40/YVTN/BNR-like repeat-containing protein [Elongatibacter sediminis]|uniref:Sortilin N-terminal domain-containing protein n=1 Tax=Elongatibacter sediminis TaxID=3119006 RepID=A0AAW9RC41_9GAMM